MRGPFEKKLMTVFGDEPSPKLRVCKGIVLIWIEISMLEMQLDCKQSHAMSINKLLSV